MISVLEELNSLMGAGIGDGAEKTASHIAKRQSELSDAPNEKFALVLFDGESTYRKFPVATAEDIRISKIMLDKIAAELPDEIVDTARCFIDLASREINKTAAYDDAPDMATNVVYVGHIDHRPWIEKIAAKRSAPVEKIAGYQVTSQASVRRLADAFSTGLGLSRIDWAESGVKLAKKAEEFRVPLDKYADLKRFTRTVAPMNLNEQILYRKGQAPDVLGSYYDDLQKEAWAASTPEDLLDVAKCIQYLDTYSGFVPAEGELSAEIKLAYSTPDPVDLVFPYEEPVVVKYGEKLAGYFGEEFASLYDKDPESAMRTLTPSERLAIQQLVA